LQAADTPTLTLHGDPVQGGLLNAHTSPGATAWVDGRPTRVSPDGEFLVGLGRDAKPQITIEVSLPGGEHVRHSIDVKKRAYHIERIDGLPPRKVTPTQADLARIREEIALVKAARRRDDARVDYRSGFQWPVTGRISGVYGSQRVLNGEPRRPHFGVDIAAPPGTEVQAPADGVVTLAHPGMFYSGATLILDHGHGLSSAFLHMRRILVTQGQRVVRGQTIGEVGATGRVTGPHLDWRINLFDKRLDPQLLVGPMPAP